MEKLFRKTRINVINRLPGFFKRTKFKVIARH